MASHSVPMEWTEQQIQEEEPYSQPDTTMNQKHPIWAGIIEYQEKPIQPGTITAANRITHRLCCQISCYVINGEPEINAVKWPNKLILSLLPRQLIMRLLPILNSSSYHTNLQFANDYNQGLSKLNEFMKSNWVGCIQFTFLNIRLMIVLYMADKRRYMGFVPHDQDQFYRAMKEIIEAHKMEIQTQRQLQREEPFPEHNTSMDQLNESQFGFLSASNDIPEQIKEQMRPIWAGVMEYQVKPVPPGPTNAANRITHSLYSQFFCYVINGVPEINAEKWPGTLFMSIIPKLLIMKLFPILKSASYHIILKFAYDNNQGLSKLNKIMNTNWVGCIQFTSLNIRIMIVLYMADKRKFIGFVPHNQDQFYRAMKEIIETHKMEIQTQRQLQDMSLR